MAYSSSSSPEISVNTTVDSQDQFSYKLASHDEVLEDLSSRFILNLPDEELSSLERICFQVEQAHWFYEDFIREENPKFPSLPLKKFSAMLFHACPLLHQWSHDHEQAFNTFMQYKTRVPVCGAIMLNDTWEKCILVKGWKSSSGWGFPKGKINEHEAPHDCAAREVLEETGYNLAGQIDPQDVIEMSIKEQKISLYIVAGVSEDFHFQTRTRKEISRIEWFKLTDLPTWKRNKAAPGKFYLISPFIGALKAFINERKPRGLRKSPMKTRTAAPQQTQILQNNIMASFIDSLGTYHDPATQESSSQSSSADNGGPHTPSPHYSEPITRHFINGNMASVEVEDDGSRTMATSMDSNLTRLLNSLSMSASVPAEDKENAKPSLGDLSVLSGPRASITPVPIIASSSSPHLLPQSTVPSDWSSHVPMPLAARPTDSLQPSPTTNQSVPQRARQTSARIHHHPSNLSLNPRQDDVGTPLGSRHVPTPPSSAALSTASAASSTSSVRKVSRRSSSTADISPYLSRPSEVPTSGKRLRQLALLETVADESLRLTPQLGNRELLPQLDNRYNGAQGYQMPLSGRPHYIPGPSASVPPVSTDHDMNDLRVIYSSTHGPAPSQSLPFHNLPPPQIAPPIHDDPFQVRPRTSQSHYQNSAYAEQPFVGRPPSAHQNQLLSLLTGPSQGLGPQRMTPALPAPHLVGPYNHSQPHPLAHTMVPRGPPPPHMMPPNMYALQGYPVPFPAPPLSPSIGIPPPPNNSNLLSILNGTRPALNGREPNVMPPPGVLNGVARR